MPFSFASRPEGRVAWIRERFDSASCLVTSRVNGLNEPPAGFVVPALRLGEKPPFAHPSSTVKVDSPLIGEVPDQGTISVCTPYVPQAPGITSGARGPDLSWRCNSSNGNCGVSEKVADNWPFVGSASILPGSFR